MPRYALKALDPTTAGDDLLGWMYDLRRNANAEAAPAEPFDSRQRVVGRWRHPAAGDRTWAWLIDGVGFATLDIYPGSATGFVRLVVAPEHRRGGNGRALAEAALHQARECGCPMVTSMYGTDAGAAFAASMGGRSGGATVRSVLRMPARIAPKPRPGFILRSWSGQTPDELLSTVALARQAIADAPFEGGFDATSWTPDKIRDVERAVTARGVDMRVTIALDESGRAVAITELRVGAESVATTEDTSVVRDQRRRGLGTLVKAESLRLLAIERPDVTTVTTSNHETNAGMLEINRRLGFVPVSRWTSAVIPVR